MRTVRSSSRLLGGGGVCPGGLSQHALGQTPPCEQNDWQTGVKHYLSATSFADGNKNTFQ